MFTNNPLLLKRHIAEVFPAVPEIFGTRAVFSAELGRSKPDPEAFHRLATVWISRLRRSCISTTMLPMSRAQGGRAFGRIVSETTGVRTGLAVPKPIAGYQVIDR